MSGTARRRRAFDPEALGDIDDLLPPLPETVPSVSPPAPGAKPPTEPAAASVTPARPEVAPPPLPLPLVAHASSSPTPPDDALESPGSRASPPEVAVAPDVYRALRALTLRERTASPTTARSYGRVALDAVDTHADTLATYWRTPPPPRTGLFSRQNSDAPRRRRHEQAPARVPLAGIIASDVGQLDQLVVDWGAGSRSALIEAALRMYLAND
jgi:hypothetical protein